MDCNALRFLEAFMLKKVTIFFNTAFLPSVFILDHIVLLEGMGAYIPLLLAHSEVLGGGALWAPAKWG